MKIQLTPRALQRARIIKTWWRKNRSGAEEVFEQEFARVTSRLAAMSVRSPLGTVFRNSGRNTVWRVLLPKTEQFIYYAIDETNDTVVIRSIWGARRGRGPKL